MPAANCTVCYLLLSALQTTFLTDLSKQNGLGKTSWLPGHHQLAGQLVHCNQDKWSINTDKFQKHKAVMSDEWVHAIYLFIYLVFLRSRSAEVPVVLAKSYLKSRLHFCVNGNSGGSTVLGAGSVSFMLNVVLWCPDWKVGASPKRSSVCFLHNLVFVFNSDDYIVMVCKKYLKMKSNYEKNTDIWREEKIWRCSEYNDS